MRGLLLLSLLLWPLSAWAQGLSWVDWSDDIFKKAKKEKKLVLLDLEAVWCHWCHVMDAQTYADPKVKALLKKHFVTVRVDQDSRPDLSNRYEDYGWPATVIFNSDGQELAKRAGFIAPGAMLSMLQAFVDDPTPGPSIVAEEKVVPENTPELSAGVRAEQEKLFKDFYDQKESGWGKDQKFMNWSAVELALKKAADGDKVAEKMAKETLAQQRRLIDPVWGGVYQYSTGGVWTEPHFEKIMQFQAENLRAYALAFAQLKDPIFQRAVDDVAKFLLGFMQAPDGGFYTSMDADLKKGKHSADYFRLDDAKRRKQGLPAIDKNQYARENAWAIRGLAYAFAATGKIEYLEAARRAMSWVIKTRVLPGGGFQHGTKKDGPYLGDNVAMGQAFLSLYMVTGERDYLQSATLAAEFIEKNFRAKAMPGYKSAKTGEEGLSRDENIAVGRFANLLHHYSGLKNQKEMAQNALRWLAAPQVAKRFMPGLLLLDREIGSVPIHITVVGGKADADAKALFAAAIAYPEAYKRVDWYDKAEGTLPNTEVTYPDVAKAAAFACSAKRCSLPATKPEQIAQRVEQISKKAE